MGRLSADAREITRVRITHGGVAGKDPKAEGGVPPRGLERLGEVRVPQEANAARKGTNEPMPVPSQGLMPDKC